MLEGIEVLHQTDIMGPPEWLIPVLIIGVVVVWALFVVSTRKVKFLDISMRLMFGGVCAVFYLLITAGLFWAYEPTGRYRYEATIDESVNFTEVYDRFDIIDKRGDIYTLEDKEK